MVVAGSKVHLHLKITISKKRIIDSAIKMALIFITNLKIILIIIITIKKDILKEIELKTG